MSLYAKLTQNVIDNRAIDMVSAFREVIPRAKDIDIGVGYFYLSGFEMIEDELTTFFEHGGTMRILMGNKTNIHTGNAVQQGYDELNGETSKEEFRRQLLENVSSARVTEKVRQWISNEQISVQVYTGDANYFHAKSFLFYRSSRHKDGTENGDGMAFVGSSNFTKNGLLGNTELNVFSSDTFVSLEKWFQGLWEGSETTPFNESLLEYIDEMRYQFQRKVIHPPVEASYAILANYFAQYIPETASLDDLPGDLYEHQKSGISQIVYRLNRYGTGLLCDGVGLGKTRTAAAVITAGGYRQALIIIPKKLIHQWERELEAVGVDKHRYLLVGKEKLASKNASELDAYVEMNDGADLVIVDEAHQGLRNHKNHLYHNLQYIKERRGGRIHGLLLTATPWNNSRLDIYNLGRLFLNPANIAKDKPYYPALFHNLSRAKRMFERNDDVFQSFWRDIFLQRTKRTFSSDGSMQINYAPRRFESVEISYEVAKANTFERNGDRIDSLRLPHMNPIRFLRSVRSNDEVEDNISAQFKLLFLKRADSSWAAFRDTLLRVQANIEEVVANMTTIQRSENKREALQQWLIERHRLEEDHQARLAEDQEDMLELQEPTSETNGERYRRRLLDRINSITAEEATRYMALILKYSKEDLATLTQIVTELREAFERIDEKYEKVRDSIRRYAEEGRKVLVISQFATTVYDYYERLLQDIPSFRLAQVTGNNASLKIGQESFDQKEAILERFCPVSKNAPIHQRTGEEVDIVIGTETLSVGQNLQDATVLINIDLPYNPMNLEQRIGRIDRPREEDHDDVTLDILTFPSLSVIEAELALTERLRSKLQGIYEDTEFDDLVLPEYREYLNRIIQDREASRKSNGLETMIEETERRQNPAVATSETHSEVFLAAQRRMNEFNLHQAENESDEQNAFPVSFSATQEAVAVAAITYRDVNGEELAVNRIPVHINHGQWIEGITQTEPPWHQALDQSLVYADEISANEAASLQKVLEQRLEQDVLPAKVEAYNQQVQGEEDTETAINDDRMIRDIIHMMNDDKQVNAHSILEQLRSQNYSPKTVEKLQQSLPFVDRRNHPKLQAHLREVHENIHYLWKHYATVYPLVMELAPDALDVGDSFAKADIDHSTIHLEAANIGNMFLK